MRYTIERSRFGWWLAYNPEEPVGLFDSATVYRGWTKERLIRRLERRAERFRKREVARQRQSIEVGVSDDRKGEGA